MDIVTYPLLSDGSSQFDTDGDGQSDQNSGAWLKQEVLAEASGTSQIVVAKDQLRTQFDINNDGAIDEELEHWTMLIVECGFR